MIVPRRDQLDCLVQLLRKDVVYVAATGHGSGKTLVIAKMLLLFPRICSLTVSPLSELQQLQRWQVLCPGSHLLTPCYIYSYSTPLLRRYGGTVNGIQLVSYF